MPDARKSKPSSPMPHSSARISPYPYPEPSPLAATLSTELPIHLTNRTFKTLHTLVLHIPITLQTILNLLDGFTRDDAIAALTHFEVHIDFQLESIKAQIDSSEPIALLSRLFDLMDGPFSNLETFILIVLLSSRIKGPKHGQRIEQAKDIIRRALYNSLPNQSTSLLHISFFFPTTCDRYISVFFDEFGLYHLAPLVPLFPAPPDDPLMRTIDIRTIQARFPKVEVVNGKNLKLWDERWS